MLKPTNAQSVSRLLRRNGFNPHSAGDNTNRWPALLCSKSLTEVRVRVWSDPVEEAPNADDREVVAEIARLLKASGYKIRYEAGAYFLYVTGREV